MGAARRPHAHSLTARRYSACLDFFLSIVFLLLGIFPLAIQHYHATNRSFHIPENKGLRIFTDYTGYLRPHEKYIFCMGWILWCAPQVPGQQQELTGFRSLYAVTFALEAIIVINLQRYDRLQKYCAEVEKERGNPSSVATSTGYAATSSNSSFNRHVGRGVARTIEV